MAAHADPNSKLWIVGVVVVIAGTVVSNGGINLQKLSIMRELNLPKTKQRPYVLQPLWLLGFIGVIGGAVADFGGLAFAAQSLLIPLGGFTLIANLYFSRICLGERMSRRDFVSTLLILVGIIMIAVTGSKDEQSFTLDQLIGLYSEPAFIGYLIVMGSSIVGLLLFVRYAANLRRQFGPWSKQYARVHRSHIMTMPLLAGVLGAQTIWLAKSVAEMVKTTARGDNQMRFFGFYALTITVILTVMSQLHWLSTALKHAPALLVIPVFHSIFILLSIIGGGVYFKELQSMTGVQLGIFMMGLIILLAGMWLLSRRKVEGAVPPSKLYLYAIIARFVVRTRRLLRTEEAEKWPNRLHLYHCDCDCHTSVAHGETSAPVSIIGPGGQVLETIADVPEDGVDDDLDELDYALAKGRNGEAGRPAADSADGFDVFAAPAPASHTPPGTSARAPPAHRHGHTHRGSAPAVLAQWQGAADPAAITLDVAARSTAGATTSGAEASGGHGAGAGAGASLAGIATAVAADTDGATSPKLPHMCPHCLCRVTPLHIVEERRHNRALQPAAHALAYALQQGGFVSADAGGRTPGMGMSPASLAGTRHRGSPLNPSHGRDVGAGTGYVATTPGGHVAAATRVGGSGAASFMSMPPSPATPGGPPGAPVAPASLSHSSARGLLQPPSPGLFGAAAASSGGSSGAGAVAGGTSEWDATYAEVVAREEARTRAARASAPASTLHAAAAGAGGAPDATGTTTAFPALGGGPAGTGLVSGGIAEAGLRRRSRQVTKDEVDKAVARLRGDHRPPLSFSAGYYDAANPAVPSFLGSGGVAKPPRPTAGGGGGGTGGGSGAGGGAYDADVDDEAGTDDDDMVSQALDHLGEGLKRIRARTRESFRVGLSAVGATLRIGSRSGGLTGTSAATAAAAAAAAAGGETGGAGAPGGAATTTAPPITAGVAAPPGARAVSGFAPTPAAVAGEGSVAAGGTPSPAPGSSAGRHIAALLKPVANAVTNPGSIATGIASAAADVADVAPRLEGFERMRDEEDASRSPSPPLTGGRAPPPPPPALPGSRGHTHRASAPAIPRPHGAGNGGTSDTAGYESSSGASDTRHGPRRLGEAVSASDDDGTTSAAGGQGSPSATPSTTAVPGGGGGGGGGGSGSVRPTVSSKSRRRPAGRRRGTQFDNSMPVPNGMVVGAGLEGISAVTIAAIKKLFAPAAGGDGSGEGSAPTPDATASVDAAAGPASPRMTGAASGAAVGHTAVTVSASLSPPRARPLSAVRVPSSGASSFPAGAISPTATASWDGAAQPATSHASMSPQPRSALPPPPPHASLGPSATAVVGPPTSVLGAQRSGSSPGAAAAAASAGTPTKSGSPLVAGMGAPGSATATSGGGGGGAV